MTGPHSPFPASAERAFPPPTFALPGQIQAGALKDTNKTRTINTLRMPSNAFPRPIQALKAG